MINNITTKVTSYIPRGLKSIAKKMNIMSEEEKVNVLFSSFERVPLNLLFQEHSGSRNVLDEEYLCLLLITYYGIEIWVFKSYNNFYQLFFKQDESARIMHFIPTFSPPTSSTASSSPQNESVGGVDHRRNPISKKLLEEKEERRRMSAPLGGENMGILNKGKEENKESNVRENEREGRNNRQINSVSQILSNHAPVFGVVKEDMVSGYVNTLELFSLVNQTYFHVIRVTSEIIEFTANRRFLVIGLSNAELKIYSLHNLQQVLSIQTMYVDPSFKQPEQDTQGAVWDISAQFIAYLYTEIVAPSKFNEFANDFIHSSFISKYSFTQDATKGLLYLGGLGYNKFMNILNVTKAGKIEQDISEGKGGGKDHERVIKPSSAGNNPDFSYFDFQAGDDFDRERTTSSNQTEFLIAENPQPTNIETNLKSAELNKTLIVIRNLSDNKFIGAVSPPYFENISIIKFSPSGTLLLVGNENGQYFYVYKIFPETNYRHVNKSLNSQRRIQLFYSLFRGYTSATIGNVNFSACEKWLILNSIKGTSHIYRLDQNIKYLDENIVNNHTQFKYDAFEKKRASIFQLSAFNRFKYNKMLERIHLRPCTHILNFYPLEELQISREILVRKGAILLSSSNSGDSFEEDSLKLPIFLSFTSKNEIFSNSLLTFGNGDGKLKVEKEKMPKIQEESFNDTVTNYGENEASNLSKLMGQRDGVQGFWKGLSFPNKHNYYNDKLLIEGLDKFSLNIQESPQEIGEVGEYFDLGFASLEEQKTYTLFDIKQILIKNESIEELASLSETLESSDSDSLDSQDENENYHSKQKHWLSYIETDTFFSKAAPITVLPHFKFCSFTHQQHSLPTKSPPLTQTAEEEKNTIISKEAINSSEYEFHLVEASGERNKELEMNISLEGEYYERVVCCDFEYKLHTEDGLSHEREGVSNRSAVPKVTFFNPDNLQPSHGSEVSLSTSANIKQHIGFGESLSQSRIYGLHDLNRQEFSLELSRYFENKNTHVDQSMEERNFINKLQEAQKNDSTFQKDMKPPKEGVLFSDFKILEDYNP